MADLEPAGEKNLDGYGAPLIAWETALDRLRTTWTTPEIGAGFGTHWLATTDADGKPHVVPLGAAWVDDRFYFTAGAGTRKARNLARDPRCNITLSAKGLDLVVEGTAVKVTDDATLQRLAAAYNAHGWEATVQDGAFTAPYSAPSAGPAPWELYEVTATTIFGLSTGEPGGATRWTF
jgi:hypothetical protein